LSLLAPTKLGVTKAALVGSPKITAEATIATAPTDGGWTFEAAIPIATFVKNQNEKWHSFQMTPILADVDDAGEQPTEIVARGTTEARTRSTNYPHFVRKRADVEAAVK
ncbi:MAG: hypothetical protein JNL96_09745, partial [Planctomycetaceae bacterium]|nr:hypothetical protein [Planctomycetaceae bacterium]